MQCGLVDVVIKQLLRWVAEAVVEAQLNLIVRLLRPVLGRNSEAIFEYQLLIEVILPVLQ